MWYPVVKMKQRLVRKDSAPGLVNKAQDTVGEIGGPGRGEVALKPTTVILGAEVCEVGLEP